MSTMNNNKHYITLLALFLLMLGVCGCTGGKASVAEQELQNEQETAVESVQTVQDTEADSEAEEPTAPPAVQADEEEQPTQSLGDDLYGNYRESGGEIACVIDGTLKDGSYNEAICRGIQTYALAAGVSFSYYHTAEDESDVYEEVISRAAKNQAKIVICSGYGFGDAVSKLQDVYPEISFLLIDGELVDEKGNPSEMSKNVHGILFKEEEAGYLAGYMAVKEGYRKFGFIGGKEEPAVIRYGYGYLQGIDMAAQEEEIPDIEVKYWYSGSYEPNDKTVRKAGEWYEKGTEIIFACGGGLYQSVVEAADRYDGMLIGVDIDQHELSEHILTSAFKDVENAVIISLDDYYAAGGHWSAESAGKTMQYGVKDNCVGIPTLSTEWRFENVTVKEYSEIYKKIKKNEVTISDRTDVRPKVSVRVNYVK